MTDQPTMRPVDDGDVDRICELAESSMTAEYSMSPDDIETILEAQFVPEVLDQRLEGDDTLAFVAELEDPEGVDADTLVAGYVEAVVTEDGVGEIRWLYTDPERRGQDIGTALFEHIQSALDDRGATPARALALADNTSSGSFFERFGFEQIGQRDVDLGGWESAEYVYTEGGEAVGESSSSSDETTGETADETIDETAYETTDETTGETTDETTSETTDEANPENPAADAPDTITTDDGKSLTVGDDHYQGTEGGFLPTFSKDQKEERYGFYCLNCGSTEVSVGSTDAIECADCSNTRKPEEYDDSYL